MATPKSEYTKNLKRKLWVWRILDIILLFLPLTVYICLALFDNNLIHTTTAQKVTVDVCVMVALILSICNVIAQKRLRCPIWIILIGLHVAVREYLLPLIIILAVITTLDDLCLTPLIDYYKSKVIASKTYDERESEGE